MTCWDYLCICTIVTPLSSLVRSLPRAVARHLTVSGPACLTVVLISVPPPRLQCDKNSRTVKERKKERNTQYIMLPARLDLHASGTFGYALIRTSTSIGFFYFSILILNIWKDFKVMSRVIQKCLRPLASSAHGLYRILSSYWLANLKKSSKLQLLTFPHILGPIWWKRLRFVPIQPICWRSRRIRWIFVWRGSELWRLFKWWERFRGTQKEDDREPQSIQSSLVQSQ